MDWSKGLNGSCCLIHFIGYSLLKLHNRLFFNVFGLVLCLTLEILEICVDQWKWGPVFCLREESFSCFCSSCSAALEGNVSFRSQNLQQRPTFPVSNLSTMATTNPRPTPRRRGPAFLCLPWTTLGSRSPLSLHYGYCWPLLPKLVRLDETLELRFTEIGEFILNNCFDRSLNLGVGGIHRSANY